ncbi:MAG: 30S ribosomal protein S15 [Xanthomonadaceae bacterium]|nr:30S ribosomal protein S15 [Xanthomonadaceae bacterium]
MAGKTAIKENKAKIIKKYAQGASDTGSTEVQVALITDRINELNNHFKTHKKDFHSNRGLIKLVGQRRRLVKYLKATDEKRYVKLIQSLDLRK